MALENSSPKTGRFAFCHKTASSLKQADLRDMFKNSTSVAQVFEQ
jgi:hypothetical protein